MAWRDAAQAPPFYIMSGDDVYMAKLAEQAERYEEMVRLKPHYRTNLLGSSGRPTAAARCSLPVSPPHASHHLASCPPSPGLPLLPLPSRPPPLPKPLPIPWHQTHTG